MGAQHNRRDHRRPRLHRSDRPGYHTGDNVLPRTPSPPDREQRSNREYGEEPSARHPPMGQDLRNIPRPRNNRPSRLAHIQCDNRASRHHRPSGQRDSFITLPATIPDTNGRLLLLESCKNLAASSRPDARGTNRDVPGWDEALPHLRHTESLLSHVLYKMRSQAQLTTAKST